MRKWASNNPDRDYTSKMGAGVGYAAMRINANVHVPQDHWTFRAQRKGKASLYHETALAIEQDTEDEYAELDLEADQLEAYEEYRAEAEDLEELFR